MARPPAYRLYKNNLATMHYGNDLQELIRRGKQLSRVLGGRYKVKDTYGKVVWDSEGDIDG